MKTLQWSKIGENIFLIEKGEIGIVYAPLLGKFFSVDADGISLVKEYLANPEEGNEFYQYLLENEFFQEVALPQGRIGEKYGPTELYLSLTSGCNLACRYCYARAGENSRRLSWERIEVSINQLYRYAKENEENEVETMKEDCIEFITSMGMLADCSESVPAKIYETYYNDLLEILKDI